MRRFSVPRSALLTAISLLLLTLLTSCNRREDILLPPNLDPKEYVISNRIQVYADHLIRCENDDSYLYLPKESISDSLIWYGDTIYFNRVEHILERDSLALAEGSQRLSNTYRVQVSRNGESISFADAADFATLYLDLKGAGTEGRASLISWEYLLNAEDIDIYPYGKKRAFFAIDGTGDFALAELSDSNELLIERSEADVQGLLKDGDTTMRVFIPAEFTTDMGESLIRMKDGLQPDQLQTVQELYKGFAMLSKVLQITTENSGSSSHPPIIHYSMPASKSFGTKWLKMNDGRIDSWESGEDTWLIEDNKLISFINGSGDYFLLEPIASQNTLSISLDGTYNQIYLQDLWLDTKGLNLPGTELEITANPSIADIKQDYFGFRPYTHSGQLQAYQFSFKAGSETLESLPDDGWLELGFAADLSEVSTSRLMRVYRDPDKDIISYKTYATKYDEQHFTADDSFVYTGLSSSGTYLFGRITENSTTQQIPCIKDQLYLQMDKTTVSYQDSSLPCSAIRIDYGASIFGNHPWLDQQPYFLTDRTSLLQIASIDGNVDALPQGLFLKSRMSIDGASVVNFSPLASYPKLIRYNKSNSLEHNSFLYKDGILSISPAYAGYLIDAQNLTLPGSSRDLAMYPKMVFDDYDMEVYLNSAASMPQSTLRIQKSATLSDPYQVLQNQYNLTYLSPAYSFQMLNNLSFYTNFQPYLRIKHQSRSQDLLFSVSNEENYRIYSYPEGDAADGWQFLNSDGHFAFYLPYDAQYAIVKDLNPHSAAQISLSTGQDGHLSLYQAQVFMPEEQIGSSIAAGSIVKLERLESVPGGIDSRSAYQLGIT
ncbi:MAG TPA: hypothetical protein PLX77_04085, partial [Candidatus Cloacimonadota bacterium]|nr:hypothetical protein [Candidatus Cloacimonadota bacterium]